jgi:hypothetical protein
MPGGDVRLASSGEQPEKFSQHETKIVCCAGRSVFN